MRKEVKGITLIALVVTIVVLLILAAVSISMLGGENGIITQAQNAKEENIHGKVKEAFILKQSEHTLKKTEGYEKDLIQYLKSADGNNILNENNEINMSNLLGNSESLGNGNNKSDVYMVESDNGTTYFLRYYDKKGESKDLLEFQINGDSTGNIDWDEIFDNAQKHPDQSDTNNDIGIDSDGNSVNMDLWESEKTYDDEGYDLSGYFGCGDGTPGYKGEITEEGKIEGKIPQYIKKDGDDKFYPVLELNGTFSQCENLRIPPQIPSTVKIMKGTFYHCTNLTQFPEIPSTVTSIGWEMFDRCNNLTNINIPSNVTNIGENAFEHCEKLISINIPNSITSIARYAFFECSNLVTVNYSGTMEQWQQISIGDYNGNLTNAQIICTDGIIDE